MKTLYKVGNLEFTSKKKSQNYARTQLRNNNNRTITEEDDLFSYLMALVELHPNKKCKIGKGIKSFKIQDDYYGNISMNIYQIDNPEKVSFSWHKVASFSKPKELEDFTCALRVCIRQQIKEFKKNKIMICELCKNTNEIIHVDHIIQFAKLKEDFLKINKENIPLTFDKHKLTNERMFKKEDKKINDDFFNYHLEHAKLRLLCKTCNLKRKKY